MPPVHSGGSEVTSIPPDVLCFPRIQAHNCCTSSVMISRFSKAFLAIIFALVRLRQSCHLCASTDLRLVMPVSLDNYRLPPPAVQGIR